MPANHFLVDIHRLSRQAGTVQHQQSRVETPPAWGNQLAGAAAGSPLDLTFDLTAVGEGVWVSGRADYRLSGQCCRCLALLDRPAQVHFQELFVWPGRSEDDQDLSRTDGQTIDLEPVIRDAVVLDLPWAPVCEDDCAGLCVECGANLNENPSHAHADLVDARWASLVGWVPSGETEPGDLD